ncbi:MAG TPA: hypothetical protein VLW50_32720 [Streptosporangiaceae bacterium]|nr:hypothetical protein [Streptosporangiaceae bacterium]
MHPIIQRDLMRARVADLRREAERVRATRSQVTGRASEPDAAGMHRQPRAELAQGGPLAAGIAEQAPVIAI